MPFAPNPIAKRKKPSFIRPDPAYCDSPEPQKVADLNFVLAQHHLHARIDHADVVLPLEQRRDGEIQMQQAVDRNHGGADRSFHREHHVARHFDKLPDEAEIRAAVRHDLRAVGAGARHELAGDVGHHDRDGQH